VKTYSLSHLADHVLLHDLRALVAQDRVTTAAMLAHLAEVDARKLYLPAAYSSMYLYCAGELRLSEDAAFKRIQAARTAREFPKIITAVEEGRLHLSAVVLLAPHLTRATSGELLEHAAYKTSAEIRLVLAQRFPQPDLVTFLQAIAPAGTSGRLAPEQVRVPTGQLAPEQVARPAGHLTARPGAPEATRARVTPLSPQRFALQVTVGQATHDKLRRAQELPAHTLPPGDVAQVLDRALDALIHQLERRRLAAKDQPRSRRSSANGRYIPAEAKRKVAERDREQCTFVSESGPRCAERKFLEYDQVDAVARGDRSTVSELRMRCRAHNQYEAERAFGKGFMDEKRQEARRKAARACEAAPARMAKLARNGVTIPAAPV
jgi:hypothetical protein